MPELIDKQQLQATAQVAKSYILEQDTNNVNTIINALQSSSGSGQPAAAKLEPTLSLGSWTKNGSDYSATITYNGDGILTSSPGDISNNTVTVTDTDGTFAGVISASEGSNYAAAKLAFYHNVEGGGSAKAEGLFTYDNPLLEYNGDGIVYRYDANNGFSALNTEDSGDYSMHRDPEWEQWFFAPATDNYTAAFIHLDRDDGPSEEGPL